MSVFEGVHVCEGVCMYACVSLAHVRVCTRAGICIHSRISCRINICWDWKEV